MSNLITNKKAYSIDEFKSILIDIGKKRYHNLHPFHKMMYSGKCSKHQLQAWALNRFYYQCAIPIKDALMISKLPTVDLRREWRRRLEDHDGNENNIGGIEKWLQLTRGLDLDNDYVKSFEGVLPATVFAVNAYVEYVRDKPILQAIASSLTEMFSPTIIAERTEGMLAHYDFISPETLEYFTPRLTQAPVDVEFALGYVLHHAVTLEQQHDVVCALRFKCDVLWAQMDALYYAYVTPGLIPLGAFGNYDNSII